MKKVIFLIYFLYGFWGSYAQSIYHGNVILISQESVDNFGAWDYDEIDGALIIQPAPSATETDISDLSALLPLKKVNEIQIEYNPHLKNLYGLDSLRSVNKAISISGNDSLQSLLGLGQINNVIEDAFYFYIADNKQLSSLDGFPSGIKKLSEINLSDNDNLSDISALENMESIGKFNGYRCTFPNLQALANLKHLQNLDITSSQLNDIALPNIMGSLVNIQIQDNPFLKTISGFNLIADSLKINSSSIKIINNPSLQYISGFENIKHFYAIIIQNNNNLLDFNSLFHSLKTIDNLTISQNPRLKSFGPFANPFPKIAQNIEITLNDSLASVQGLLGLERVKGSYSNDGRLYLRNNPLLPNLNGLDSLKYTEYISFRFTNVSTLSPLSHLDSIGFTLFLHNELGDLKTLDGLQNISSIKSGFAAYNKNLKDLSALFESNTNVGRLFILSCDSLMPSLNIHNLSGLNYIDISSNPTLETITGLENIDSLHETFLLRDNKKLQIFSALKNLQFLSTSNSPGKLHTNPNLTDISGLCHLFTEGTIAGTIDIHDNAAGFNSQQEIIEWCMTPTIDLPTWDAIAVYPNPTADAFFVDVPMDLIQVGMMVDLVDISGVSHFSARIKDSVSSIPVGDLAPGLYFLRIVFDGRLVQVKKVLVER